MGPPSLPIPPLAGKEQGRRFGEGGWDPRRCMLRGWPWGGRPRQPAGRHPPPRPSCRFSLGRNPETREWGQKIARRKSTPRKSRYRQPPHGPPVSALSVLLANRRRPTFGALCRTLWDRQGTKSRSAGTNTNLHAPAPHREELSRGRRFQRTSVSQVLRSVKNSGKRTKNDGVWVVASSH